MVNLHTQRWYVRTCLAALALSFGCSSGSNPKTVGTDDPIPIPLTLVSIPVLDASPPERWIVGVNQQVQFHAIDPTTGQQVDNKVSWNVYPHGSGDGFPGSIDQTGKYTAPSNPKSVVLVVRSPADTPLVYMASKDMDVVQ